MSPLVPACLLLCSCDNRQIALYQQWMYRMASVILPGNRPKSNSLHKPWEIIIILTQ